MIHTYRSVLIAALLVLFACLGLGRFGFGMVLPNLQENLAISTTQAGFIGTANFIGYLIGIFFVTVAYKNIQTYKLISGALLLQGLSMLLMILPDNYNLTALAYSFSGFFAAIANVSIMIYIAHIIPQNLRGKALGIIITGNGLAIIFSGLVVPFIEINYTLNSWRLSWTVFALLTIAIALFVRKGLSLHDNKHETTTKVKGLLKMQNFWKIAILYLVFGITYVVYVTFFVKASIDKYNLSIESSGFFWSVLGLMSLVSGPLFGNLADKIGAYKTLIIIYFLLTISNILLTLDIPSFMLFLSVSLFGIAAWSIPSLITLVTSITFGKEKTAYVFSLITIIFAIGQAIAPIGAGFIFDLTHNFTMVFLLCALLTIFGMLSAYIFSKQKN